MRFGRGLKWAAALCALSTTLGACSMPMSTIEELMQAPKLSESQTAVYDALGRSIGTDNFVLKYPRSGKYRSAFVFYDIDQDGADEAIVFYQLGSASGTRINILDDRGDRWESVYDVSGEDDSEVEYIQFESIESADYKNILIGWRVSTSPTQSTQMSIYRYESDAGGGRLANASDSITRLEYDHSIIRDVDGDGLSDIVLLARRRTNSSYRMLLISSQDGQIDQTDSISFGQNVNGILNLVFGRLADGRLGLFLDVALSNSYFATEILVVEDKRLVPLIDVAEIDLDSLVLSAPEEDTPEEPVPEEAAPETTEEEAARRQRLENFLATLRAEEVLSADVNGDSVIEVPSTAPLLGYEHQDGDYEEVRDEEMKYLTTFSVYRSGAMTPVMSGCVNLRAGYLVRFPERWIGAVTVYSENDLTQWRFIRYNGSLNDLSMELLRIRRTSKNDFQDRLETNPILLNPDQGGATQFYGYLPPTEDDELAIDEDELRDMFILL